MFKYCTNIIQLLLLKKSYTIIFYFGFCFYFCVVINQKTMETKRVTRYFSECGRGFWTKHKAIDHEENCKCWRNPKFKTCISCKHKDIRTDSNGMEHEPYNLETWQFNNCSHSDNGVPVHKDFSFIRKYCPFHQSKK